MGGLLAEACLGFLFNLITLLTEYKIVRPRFEERQVQSNITVIQQNTIQHPPIDNNLKNAYHITVIAIIGVIMGVVAPIVLDSSGMLLITMIIGATFGAIVACLADVIFDTQNHGLLLRLPLAAFWGLVGGFFGLVVYHIAIVIIAIIGGIIFLSVLGVVLWGVFKILVHKNSVHIVHFYSSCEAYSDNPVEDFRQTKLSKRSQKRLKTDYDYQLCHHFEPTMRPNRVSQNNWQRNSLENFGQRDFGRRPLSGLKTDYPGHHYEPPGRQTRLNQANWQRDSIARNRNLRGKSN